jgi:hypothetical protein
MDIPHEARIMTAPERFGYFAGGNTQQHNRKKKYWTTLERGTPQHASYSSSVWHATYLGNLTIVFI